MRIFRITFLSFLLGLAIFSNQDLLANPQNFYQQHLRSARNTADPADARAGKAMGKLAARISGQPSPRSIAPTSATTIASDTDIIELLKITPGQQGLTIAQNLKRRLSQRNFLLEEYIARCLWSVGDNARAAELSNALLLEYESPSLRRFLANDAQKKGAHDLAIHHLARSDVTESKRLLTRLQIWLSEVSHVKVFLAAIAVLILLYIKPGIKASKSDSRTSAATKNTKIPETIEHKTATTEKKDSPAKSRKSFAGKGKKKQTKTSYIPELKTAGKEISESVFAGSAQMPANQTESEYASNGAGHKSAAIIIDETQNNSIEMPDDPDQTPKNPNPLSPDFSETSEIVNEPSAKLSYHVEAVPEIRENHEHNENPGNSTSSGFSEFSSKSSNTPSSQSIRTDSGQPESFQLNALEQHFDNKSGFIEPESARLFFLGLQLALSEKMMRTLGITSATENANRALAAFQLARMFADDDYKTLLIDANDSGQFLHEIYGCEPAPGLADLINPDNSFATVFRKTEQAQLTLLTCGSETTGFSDLSDQALELLLSYCRKNFEIIILILPVADKLREKLSIIKDFGVVFLDSNASCKGYKWPGLPLATNSLSVLGKILSNQE